MLKRLIDSIKYNSLSIVLIALFAICMFAQSYAGWRDQNETLTAQGQASIGFWDSLFTATFQEGLAANWQAAFLQLASLILFSSFLYQRGAPHSRDPLLRTHKPSPKPGRFSWLYRNSLFLAFLLLFLIALGLHIVFGANAFNEARSLMGMPPISITAFLLSARFWSSTLQTWQAEYLAIAIFVVLSVFLRQEGSAESKPVEASNESTGEANK